MAFSLTRLAQEAAEKINKLPQLVLEIDGVPTIYGIGSIKKYIRIGDVGLTIGDDWVIGGFNEVEDQLDSISLSGSTTTITQQLLQDKGGTSSVSSVQLSLVDVGGAITELITPGEVVDDILGRKATVYLGFQETAYPQDFIVIFTGVIDEVTAGAAIVLNIAHPEAKKRAEIFQPMSTVLTANADFKSETIQSIRYQTRRGVAGTVTVAYTGGGTAGSEIVTVTGNAISVQIQSGVSTADQVRRAVEAKPEATALVLTEILEGETATVQTTVGATSLSSDTTITVASTEGFLLPAAADGFTTFIRINDEIIQYTGLTDTTFTGCTREAFVLTDPRARGGQHQIDDEVTSFYRLQGSAIDLALKVLMSGGPEYFAENVSVSTFVDVEEVGDVPNAVYFQGINVKDKYGIVTGDFVTITGDLTPANNVTDAPVSSVLVTEFGSYLILDDSVTLVETLSTSAVAKFKTQFDVLPDGLGLGGDQVDVPEFIRISETYVSSLFDYDYYLTEETTGKEFVDEKLLFPTGAFTLPRKGKISVGYSSPPLAVDTLPQLTSDNTAKPDQNKISRSTNKNFYNNLLFKYNNNVLDADKFLTGDLTRSETSKTRIPVGNKVFTIEAPGLRDSASTDDSIAILRNRILDRYKFGAEKISTQVFYGDAFNIDVGDIVLYGDNAMKLPDTKNATRNFEPRLFEITNKSLDIKSGIVKLELVDTQYSAAGARFGVFSPGSIVGTGSTTTQIVITDSYGTVSPAIEKDKWLPYVGQNILIRNEDFTVFEEVEFTGFLSGNNYVMLLGSALGFTPSAGYLVEIATYPTDTNPSTAALYKNSFCFSDPQVQVASGVSGTVFTVGAGDVSKLFVGSYVILHNDDWTTVSVETQISDITGTTITVADDLGFTPSSSEYIDLIGFPDEGSPFRYI